MKKFKLIVIACTVFLILGMATAAYAASELDIVSITASNEETDKGNVAACAVDEDLATRWSGTLDWNEDTDKPIFGTLYLDVDLGESKMVSGFQIAQYRGDQRTVDFKILVSNDGVNYTQAFEGTTSGQTNDYQDFTFTPAEGRYVRILTEGAKKDQGTGDLTGWVGIFEMNLLGDDVTIPQTGDAGIIPMFLLGAAGLSGIALSLKRKNK